MKKWIAKRELLYSVKGTDKRSELIIRISEPYLLKEGMVKFNFAEGTAGCSVEYIGLKEGSVFEGENVHEVYGADSLQALQLAADVEPTLRRLSKKYDIYFPCGELYFDPDKNE